MSVVLQTEHIIATGCICKPHWVFHGALPCRTNRNLTQIILFQLNNLLNFNLLINLNLLLLLYFFFFNYLTSRINTH